jgi:hypothetical protein
MKELEQKSVVFQRSDHHLFHRSPKICNSFLHWNKSHRFFTGLGEKARLKQRKHSDGKSQLNHINTPTRELYERSP